MASTEFPAGHPLAAELWSKKTFVEALAQTHASKFMGTDAGSLLQVVTETQKDAGDTVHVPLLVDLIGDGVSEGVSLEGNEEALTYYRDSLVINELAHAVELKERIDKQRVPMRLREDARQMLQQWWSNRIDTIFFNQLAGISTETRAVYNGFQTPNAPSSSSAGNTNAQRIIYGVGTHTTENSLSASGTAEAFSLTCIDLAVNVAKRTSPLVRPIKVGSQEYYVCFIHPDQARSLRTTTSTGGWLDIQKAAMMGGEVNDNPIFSGALGVYNNTVIHENRRVPLAPGHTTVRRAIFCGAQAGLMAYGKGYSERMDWIEEAFDYERRFGVSVQSIFGMKKTRFNGSDFGSIVISTRATSPV